MVVLITEDYDTQTADTLLVLQKQQQHSNEEKQAAGMPELASHSQKQSLRNVA